MATVTGTGINSGEPGVVATGGPTAPGVISLGGSSGSGVVGQGGASACGVIGLSGFSGAPHDTGPPPPFVGLPPGVLGMSMQNPGVNGSTQGSQPAIVGLGGKSNGVWGFSPSDSGVWGGSTFSNGVTGEGFFGVRGTSKTKGSKGPTAGVMGEHTAGDIGVWGTATGGLGVVGDGALGGVFTGTRAPVRLVPSKIKGSPTSGHHQMGELYADAVGELFYCVADGTPGIWKMVKLV